MVSLKSESGPKSRRNQHEFFELLISFLVTPPLSFLLRLPCVLHWPSLLFTLIWLIYERKVLNFRGLACRQGLKWHLEETWSRKNFLLPNFTNFILFLLGVQNLPANLQILPAGCLLLSLCLVCVFAKNSQNQCMFCIKRKNLSTL